VLFFVDPPDIKVGLQNDAKRIQRRHRQTPSTSAAAAAAVLMHSACSHRAVIMTSPQDERRDKMQRWRQLINVTTTTLSVSVNHTHAHPHPIAHKHHNACQCQPTTSFHLRTDNVNHIPQLKYNISYEVQICAPALAAQCRQINNVKFKKTNKLLVLLCK